MSGDNFGRASNAEEKAAPSENPWAQGLEVQRTQYRASQGLEAHQIPPGGVVAPPARPPQNEQVRPPGQQNQGEWGDQFKGRNPIDSGRLPRGTRPGYGPSGTVPGADGQPPVVIPAPPPMMPNPQDQRQWIPVQPGVGGQPWRPIDPNTGQPIQIGPDGRPIVQARPGQPGGPSEPAAAKLPYNLAQVEADIERSLYRRSSPFAQLGSGAFWGTTIGGVQYGAEHIARNVPQESRGVMAKFFTDSYHATAPQKWTLWGSDKVAEGLTYANDVKVFATKFETATTAKTAADAALKLAQGEKLSAFSKVLPTLDSGSPVRFELQKEILKVASKPEVIEEAVDDVGQKIFSGKQLAAAKDYVAKRLIADEAETVMGRAASEFTAAENALLNAERSLKFSGAGLARNVGKGLGVGLAVAGSEMAVNSALDWAFGHNTDYHNKVSWGLNSVAIPAILLSPMATRYKVGATAMTLGLSYGVDVLARPTDARFQELLRPNWFEVAAGTAAAMAPTRGLGKVGLLGGAWAGGRLYNYSPIMGVTDTVAGAAIWLSPMSWQKKLLLTAGTVAVSYGAHRLLENDKEPGLALRDETRAQFNKFDSELSYINFMDSVRKGKQLGIENDGALEFEFKKLFIETNAKGFPNTPQKMVEWENAIKENGGNPVAVLSAAAARSLAIGEFRRDSGTRLVTPLSKPGEVKHGAAARLMAGSEYDLGGEGVTFIRQAGMWLWEAERYGKENRASKDELEQIAQMRKYVDEQLAKTYDGHDMERVYKELKDATEANVWKMIQGDLGIGDQKGPSRLDDLLKMGPKLKQYVDGLQTNDPRQKAKYCRDYALLCIALADFGSNGGGTPARYNGIDSRNMARDAAKYLQQAMQLEPGSQDGQWMEQKIQELGPQLGIAYQRQRDSRIRNPNEIPNP